MAIKRNVEWYFGEEDRAEVKKYSNKISALFKIEGYNPEDDDDFFDFFELDDFFFIPCIKEGYEKTDGDAYDEFKEDAIKALNSAYNSSAKINLEDLEDYVKCFIGVVTVRDLITNCIDEKEIESSDYVDFIDSCGLEIKKRFINWVYNYNH